jgi:hypothetical protein
LFWNKKDAFEIFLHDCLEGRLGNYLKQEEGCILGFLRGDLEGRYRGWLGGFEE